MLNISLATTDAAELTIHRSGVPPQATEAGTFDDYATTCPDSCGNLGDSSTIAVSAFGQTLFRLRQLPVWAFNAYLRGKAE